jgi:hypothetical protein
MALSSYSAIQVSKRHLAHLDANRHPGRLREQ